MRNFCPNCGHNLKTPAVVAPPVDAEEFPVAPRNAEARETLLAKLKDVAPQFDGMSEAQWGEWVDALELDELIELITLGNEGIGKAIRAALDEL